jgi:hypothetical protein
VAFEDQGEAFLVVQFLRFLIDEPSDLFVAIA